MKFVNSMRDSTSREMSFYHFESSSDSILGFRPTVVYESGLHEAFISDGAAKHNLSHTGSLNTYLMIDK